MITIRIPFGEPPLPVETAPSMIVKVPVRVQVQIIAPCPDGQPATIRFPYTGKPSAYDIGHDVISSLVTRGLVEHMDQIASYHVGAWVARKGDQPGIIVDVLPLPL